MKTIKLQYFLILALFLLLNIDCSYGQKSRSKNVSGEYIYMIEGNISLNDAKRIAIDYARIEAIKSAFGAGVVNESNRTLINKVNEVDRVKFTRFADSDLTGEWIEDTKEPEIEVITNGDAVSIRAKVKGVVREITHTPIDITAKVLRNGTTLKDESDSFISGNDMYLYFKSPQSGYITVYLLDSDGNAFCLLPYQNSPNSVKQVTKDREYILFNAKLAEREEVGYIDEYTLTTDIDSEFNYLYVIFSPNEFVKANDFASEELIPRQLPFEKFHKWLSENRKRDTKMQIVSSVIEIKSEN